MRRGTVDRRHVDVLAGVELERGLGAVYLEVQTGVCVAELSQPALGQATRVERDLGRVGLHDEDVVDVRTRCGQLEGLGDLAGELVNLAVRDAGVV